MYGMGKSDEWVLPMKPSNNGATPAERVEGRHSTKGNACQPAAVRTQCRVAASSGLVGVREAAKRCKTTRFTALLHHVTIARLRNSFYALKRRAAPGVDGVTWQQYEVGLEDRLNALHRAVHGGSYRARPSRRTHIDKADGTKRPLGVAAVEDKIVQHAVAEVVSAIYEADFLGFSYGFRRGRGQHDALDALWMGISKRKVNWVLDADIRKFYDSIDHEWMIRLLEHRIADRRILRLISKWLAAGVMEEGVWSATEVGAAQGATISPLLANVYLHYVFDQWVLQWRQRHARGDVIVVRYADDSVLGFQHKCEAERFLVALNVRLQRFKLSLHPDKTRLIEFGRFAARDRGQRGMGKPETFDFLGFTHICARALNGMFIIRRKTVAKRMRVTLLRIKQHLMQHRHWRPAETGRWLQRVLRGYFNYYAVMENLECLRRFRRLVEHLWMRALRRRSQRHRLSWARFTQWVERWFPAVRAVHPAPYIRFAATHPR